MLELVCLLICFRQTEQMYTPQTVAITSNVILSIKGDAFGSFIMKVSCDPQNTPFVNQETQQGIAVCRLVSDQSMAELQHEV